MSLLDIKIISETADNLILEIPAYRVDVKKEADVIEEILRIYGYNNIAISNHVNSTLSYPEKPDREKIVNIISDMLSANGFSEIMCNSLNPAAWYEQSPDFDKETACNACQSAKFRSECNEAVASFWRTQFSKLEP